MSELIKQAIESAKCRVYKLNFDLNGEISAHHQKKAENQKELMEITVDALEKRLQKEVIDESKIYGIWRVGTCPSCGEVVRNSEKYCGECGQSLKWGD